MPDSNACLCGQLRRVAGVSGDLDRCDGLDASPRAMAKTRALSARETRRPPLRS
jgi:hypothetical protein